mmetsp:Transcript_34441/g.30248  ORF Transcript_34441/g.30248 Transcript_34441/m.30248 type:complete len:91 (+) Transcript_34441:1-273(+)
MESESDDNSDDDDDDDYTLRPPTGITMMGVTNDEELVPFKKAPSIDVTNLERQFSSIFAEDDIENNESDEDVINDEDVLIETETETVGNM